MMIDLLSSVTAFALPLILCVHAANSPNKLIQKQLFFPCPYYFISTKPCQQQQKKKRNKDEPRKRNSIFCRRINAKKN